MSHLLHPLTVGPLGFPQTDRQAKALEEILKAHPRDEAFRYRKSLVAQAPTEVSPGERADVSWISTEDPDRCGEVVLARGMNDRQFALNPIVTMQHCYDQPPAGKSLWRKRVKSATGAAGIKAKTVYPPRPANWPASEDWLPDLALALVQSDLLRGKSIGFLPIKVHTPTDEEIGRHQWKNVSLVIDEWILLEYACVFLPAQQNAVVEQVSKSWNTAPWTITDLKKLVRLQGDSKVIPHVRFSEYQQAVQRALTRFDATSVAARAVQNGLDRARGRV